MKVRHQVRTKVCFRTNFADDVPPAVKSCIEICTGTQKTIIYGPNEDIYSVIAKSLKAYNYYISSLELESDENDESLTT